MALFQVLRCDGPSDVFAWKHPNSELTTASQLIVNESQEALLLRGGRIYDIFGPGRHTLATANIPLLNKVVNLPFGGRSPFTAEVWFVNKAYRLDIKWGTPTPIQLQDPKYGIMVPVRSNGVFGIHIADSKAFLTKMVGTLPAFDAAAVTQHFRGVQVTKVKDAVSTYLIEKQISLLEINAYLEELSEAMRERIAPVMEEYGIELTSFYVNELSAPEDDPAVQRLKTALTRRAEMNILGYSYQQQRSFDVMEGAAKNSRGVSPVMGAGIGLGMGAGIGGAVSAGMGSITQNLAPGASGAERTCPKCHAALPAGQRFCGQCGCDTTAAEHRKAPQKTCANCGTVVPEGSKFCPECGQSLTARVCPACGEVITTGTKFCPQCGKKL